jgi:DNA-binding Xre family transcriptional regulator
MHFSKIVENIHKLMEFWNLDVNKLAEKSGITVNGLKNMFEKGNFKFESLNKIAISLNVPVIILFADWLSTEFVKQEQSFIININGFTNESKRLIVYKNGITTNCFSYIISDDYLKKKLMELEEENRENEIFSYESAEKIQLLENSLKDKNEILEFIKRENLFAFSNIIRLLMENRQANDTGIAPEKLNDLTRSKIFDEAFLKTLLDQGLITETDYQFIKAAKK